MTGGELETIVTRLLERKVPSVVISDVFELDLELVKDAQSKVRVAEYGTDDMGEYVEILRWETIQDALRAIKSGSAAERARVHTMILGKEMAVSARRTPESVRNSQNQVASLMEKMREGKAAAPAPPSRFIARMANNPDDEDETA